MDPQPGIESPSLVSRSCPVCGRTGGPTLISRPPWRLVECAGCGLAYLPEHPCDDAVDEQFEWSDSFARERRERWMRNPLMRAWTMAVLFLKPSREARALRFIRRFVSSGRALDVGCGDGRLLERAAAAGFDVLGVEPSGKMAAKAARRIGPERVKVGRLADFDLPAESFDLILTVSYLEHDPQPREALVRMHRLLKPGGICAHKTPNYASWLRKTLGRRWSGYRWPEHVQYFTPQLLGRLLTATGFEVIGRQANPLGDNFWLAARKR
ncbi:MAG: methyltransferase domain-containing protein [Planctomycetes bacterium]|nr:methyltransferase domain-containing protein [Planctomycetota bacterium]